MLPYGGEDFPLDSDSVNEVTGSVSDGTPVDWDRVETSSNLDHGTLESLRDVARIAAFNRALQLEHTDSGPATANRLDHDAPRLERWRDLTLLEPIGAGAQGEVWRAWDVTLQRLVALKFLQPSQAGAGQDTSAELLNEARALARVRHPNIITVFGIAEDKGRFGMWMECVPGVTLDREIERVGALPPQQVAQIGVQLGSALQALNTAGIVHRDIKPANVLLEGESRAVLTDFGLGWRPVLGDEAAPRSSGTPLFMAPEVLAGGGPTHQSDLYALGVTLWWALAGQSPFESKSLSELRSEASRGPGRSLHSLCPGAPRDLIDVILAAMKPSPSDRIRSAADLTPRLATFAVDHGRVPSTPSIAVLPFLNRGTGAEDEYFSDGLADELIGMLAKIRGLRVAARTSTFSFRGRHATVGEIGRALHVHTVLDGSVRRAGDRVRISVQLINVSDGLHLWSETYDRTLDDIVAVQDDIALSVVQELRSTLVGRELNSDPSDVNAEIMNASRGRAGVPAAHRLFLLGRHFINRLSRDDLTRAIQYLNEAVTLDPPFALAWAELGGAYTRSVTWRLLPKQEGIRQARDAITRALTIEPDLAEAHARQAAIQMFHDWDWNGADASYTRALELAPGDAVALNGAGVLAMVLGHVDESIALHRRAAEQDPLSATPQSNLGVSLLRARRFAEAEAALRKTLELAPQRLLSRAFLARAIADQGRREEAIAEAFREPDAGERLYALAIVHHTVGDHAESDAALQELIQAHSRDYAFQIAEAMGVRGEIDASFEWLDRAFTQRDYGLTELRCNSSFRAMHGDPRWRSLMIKMGFNADAT